MLRNAREIMGYALEAQDGDVGHCKDFLLDDELWTVRYMVADTGTWLPGRKILISPGSLDEPDWASRHFPIRLTKQEMEDSPELDEDAPVSRQYEIHWSKHHGCPYYWSGDGLWGSAPYPTFFWDQNLEEPEDSDETHEPGDSHLRSVSEMTSYVIHAEDGQIGHVEDFIIDDVTWTTQYMVVDTCEWLPGKKVLVPTEWINSVCFDRGEIEVALTRKTIEDCPKYDPDTPVNRRYEERLYDYHGRPRYWQ